MTIFNIDYFCRSVILFLCLITFFYNGLLAQTQGGGGGGKGGSDVNITTKTGKEIYTVSWSTSLDRSIENSSQTKTPILVYFEPSSSGKKKTYKLFESKSFSEASDEYSFVKISPSDNFALRDHWKVSKNKHTFHICDWYGNSLKSYSSKGTIKSKILINNLKNIDQLIKKTTSKSKKFLKKAQTSFDKQDYVTTLKYLDKILKYKGYEVVDQANDLINKITKAIEKKIDDINTINDSSEKKSQLNDLIKTYKDYPQIKKLIENVP